MDKKQNKIKLTEAFLLEQNWIQLYDDKIWPGAATISSSEKVSPTVDIAAVRLAASMQKDETRGLWQNITVLFWLFSAVTVGCWFNVDTLR